MALPNTTLQFISTTDQVLGTTDPATPNGAVNRELNKLLQNTLALFDQGTVPSTIGAKIGRGSTAQLSSYTGPAGEFNVDTTRRLGVVHDNATAGGLPMSHRFRVHIAEFGAPQTGDGGDYTTHIRNAYTALASIGGTIQFGPGTYKYTGALTPGASIVFAGVGTAKSEITDSPVQTTRLLKEGSFAGVTLLRTSGIENIILDGNNSAGDGVIINGAGCWITNALVLRHGGIGITVGDTVGSLDTNWCVFTNVTSRLNGSHGWFIGNAAATNSNGHTFTGCRAWANTGNGFRFGVTRYNVCIGCYSEGNTDKGWKILTGSDRNNFIGCSAEPIGSQHVVFDSGSVDNCWWGGGALLVTDIVDDGKNFVMLPESAQGSGVKGSYMRGLFRAGDDPQNLAALTSAHGFHAAGTKPGYSFYDVNGSDSAHRIWEQYADTNNMFFKIVNFAGTVKTTLWTILRSAADSASMTFSNKMTVRFDRPPIMPVGTYDDITTLAPAGGLNDGGLAVMTDLNSNTPGTTAAAGGANRCVVWCDGTGGVWKILA